MKAALAPNAILDRYSTSERVDSISVPSFEMFICRSAWAFHHPRWFCQFDINVGKTLPANLINYSNAE